MNLASIIEGTETGHNDEGGAKALLVMDQDWPWDWEEWY